MFGKGISFGLIHEIKESVQINPKNSEEMPEERDQLHA